MINQKVKVPFRKLKYIHHISDIQIRNLKRHREYEEVFNGLYEEVKKYPNNAVAYIGGDIAHSKTDMSPELIDQLSRLFKNLADICPTILIAGNHDCNLNNLNRLDCLTPIVDNLNHPNLHYLKRTGVYKCADTSFVVWDVWDKEKDYIKHNHAYKEAGRLIQNPRQIPPKTDYTLNFEFLGLTIEKSIPKVCAVNDESFVISLILFLFV